MGAAAVPDQNPPVSFRRTPNRWRFAITSGRVVGVVAELVGVTLPFAGCYLAFMGQPHIGICVGALGLMATAGLVVMTERRQGGPVTSILNDAKTFRDTPELARAQRAYDQRARRQGQSAQLRENDPT